MPADNGFHNATEALPDSAATRIVSLVPSLTESLLELGLGERLVGITDYCVYPAEAVSGYPRVGGTKNPRLEDILALEPDLVLANREENGRAAIEAMQAAGLKLWVTFPHSVAEAMDILWELARLVTQREAIVRLQVLDLTRQWAEDAVKMQVGVRYFCPIWQDRIEDGLDWWMTFNQETYAHDVLRLAGGENIFAMRQRSYPLEADLGLREASDPGERDTRYPRLSLTEVRMANPDLILLPDEPYAFGEDDRQRLMALLPDVRAVQAERVYLVDGSLITWHGTRLAHALRELPALFQG
jgi:iron complex transport system substrate-binding protein